MWWLITYSSVLSPSTKISDRIYANGWGKGEQSTLEGKKVRSILHFFTDLRGARR